MRREKQDFYKVYNDLLYIVDEYSKSSKNKYHIFYRESASGELSVYVVLANQFNSNFEPWIEIKFYKREIEIRFFSGEYISNNSDGIDPVFDQEVIVDTADKCIEILKSCFLADSLDGPWREMLNS